MILKEGEGGVAHMINWEGQSWQITRIGIRKPRPKKGCIVKYELEDEGGCVRLLLVGSHDGGEGICEKGVLACNPIIFQRIFQSIETGLGGGKEEGGKDRAEGTTQCLDRGCGRTSIVRGI